MTYQPFLIANYQTGLDEELPVWLLPDDAFANLQNAYIERGTIKKRQGYRKLFDVQHILSGPTSQIGSISNSNMATVGAPNHNLVDDTLIQISGVLGMTEVNWTGGNTYRVLVLTSGTFQLRNLDGTFVDSTNFPPYISGGTVTSSLTIAGASSTNPMTLTTNFAHGLQNGATVSIYGASGLVNVNAQPFAIGNVTANTFQIPLDGTLSGSYTGGGVVAQAAGLPVTGLIGFVDASGQQGLIVCDTRRLSLYDRYTNSLAPIGNCDLFSGGESDYFKSASLGINLYLTNGVDPILQIDTTAFSLQFTKPQYGPNAGDVIVAASDIVELRNRVVLAAPTYSGEISGLQPQRLTFSAINDSTSSMAWRGDVSGYGGYIDAPTGESMQCVAEFRDTLIVAFDRSLWKIRSLPNPSLPFVFERIDTVSGAYSRTSMTANQDAVLGLGDNGIFATNGATAQRLDAKIPLFVYQAIDQSLRDQIFCFRNAFTRQIWWLYPTTTGETVNTGALVYHELTNSYATYQISLSCLQRFPIAQGLRLSDFDAAHDLDVDSTTVDPNLTLSDPMFNESSDEYLGGSYDGSVCALETGSSDDEGSISMSIKSRQWNPFVSQAKNARLGYVDLVLACEITQQFEVSFFVNDSQTPYVVRTVRFDFSFGQPRQVVRVFAGGSGSFHQMQIDQSGVDAPFQLQSCIAYFAPIPGRLR